MTGREVVHFGDFRFDASTGEFWKRGVRIRLRPQLAAILSILLRHPGETISKDLFRHEIWGDLVHVDFEQALANAACELRRLLDDDANNPRYLEVLPKRGIRFLADVAPVTEGAPVREQAPAATRVRTSDTDLPTLVVLPLADLSDDPAHSHFGVGLTDELISELARVAWLRVLTSSSAKRLEHSRRAPSELAQHMGVAFVLEGSYVCEAMRIRVNVRLAHAESDMYVWAASYEREWHSPIALQREITKQIVRGVSAVVGRRQDLAARPFAAHDAESSANGTWTDPTQWGNDFRGTRRRPG